MCTRRLVTLKNQSVLVGRIMGWTTPQATRLVVFPRGIEKDGKTAENPLKWASKYGSICVLTWDKMCADGLNEVGLAAHGLFLTEARFGERDTSKPGISTSIWCNYFLDTCATVAECVEKAKEIQIQPFYFVHQGAHGETSCHFCVEDATGDSAIFEVLEGKLHIHHGKQYQTMTNSPPYEEQLVLMKQYQGLGGDMPIPGSPSSEDRFIRAAYYGNILPEPENYEMAIAGIRSVIMACSTPYGINDPLHPNIAADLWRTYLDLTNKCFYFDMADRPPLVWMKFSDFDFSEGAPIKVCNVQTVMHTASGDIKDFFEEGFKFELIEAGGDCKMIEKYPEE
jgi:choloylglycine hydrolase